MALIGKYYNICDILLKMEPNDAKLHELKLAFKHDINSQRCFERINSLSSLITTLEKRDVLGPTHMNNLMIIVDKYAATRDISIENILHSNNSFNRVNDTVLPNTSFASHKERIHEKIIDEIGYSWRQLAEALGLSESRIDMLEFQYRYRDPCRMIREILEWHSARHSTNFNRWRSQLQRALIKARRTDLSEEVDDILVNF
ncbi:hypothetical protein ABEB36_011950 [Hypothenemus hampei]|uniref:Death domain-containing protein n=1 Tax=Hypothenemus hampei TaxID=57062 RepID=A0ABD1EAD6_HYPHA